ncbi:DUF222 domain-containing protein [Galactobacter valiniphilus]|uniref:DUF222 domain-containing protein n=1 Tax=Galactobacter valiniphilus TaxID=2676122 RepID=UPI003736B4E4
MSEKFLLDQALGLLREAVEAIAAGGDRAGEAEVVELLGVASDVSRAADGLRVAISGVVGRRSEGLSRAEALCCRLGFRSTKALISQAFGVQAGAAETLVTLAQATGPRTGFSSGDLPPFRPALAVALRAGEISADQAIAVHRGLPHPGSAELQPGMTEAAERFLVDGATGGRVGFDEAGRPVITHGDPTRGRADAGAGTAAGTGMLAGGGEVAGLPGGGPMPDDAAGGLGATGGGAAGPGDASGPAPLEGPADLGQGGSVLPGSGQITGAGDGTFWNIPGVTPAGGATSVGTRGRTPADMDVWGPRRMEPHLVRVQAGAWRDAIDPDGAEPRDGEQVQRRSFKVQRASGGGWRLTGYAPEQAGAALAHFMDALTGPQAHPDRFLDPTGEHSGSAHDVPGCNADTTVDAAGRAADDKRTPEQKGFDALHSLVEAQQRQQDEAGPGGSGATLVVTVTMSALDRYARSLGAIGNAAELPGLAAWAAAQQPSLPSGAGSTGDVIGGRQADQTGQTGQASPTGCPTGRGSSGLGATLDGLFASHSRSDEAVPMSTVAAMLCTDALRLVVTDDAGTAVRLGRQQRPFSKAQRQALAARDRHCRAPGCLAPPSWCHTHHVIPWSAGGHTNLDNAILLCSFHHHELHRGRLGVVPAREVGAVGHPWAVLSVWHLRRLAAERRQEARTAAADGQGARQGVGQGLGPSSGQGRVAWSPDEANRAARSRPSAWSARGPKWTARLSSGRPEPGRSSHGRPACLAPGGPAPGGSTRLAPDSFARCAPGRFAHPSPRLAGIPVPGVDSRPLARPARMSARQGSPRRAELHWHSSRRIRLSVDAAGPRSP